MKQISLYTLGAILHFIIEDTKLETAYILVNLASLLSMEPKT